MPLHLSFVRNHTRTCSEYGEHVNTATTIVTFLMLFLIQNSQNRDAKAIHLKLDEIIRASGRADNRMIDIEKLSDEELEVLAAHFGQISLEHERRKKAVRS